MMTDNAVLGNLCTKDPRNPLYSSIWDASDEVVPRVDCHCDNCSYGRDKLAREIIRLWGTVDYLKERSYD